MKKIRFNLKFFKDDGNFDSVRSLAELEDKFNLNDLYEYFVSGQLVLWLKCHGEDAVAEKVSAVTDEKDVHNQIAKLFDALGFDFDSNEKESAIVSYLFPREFLKRRAELGESVKKVEETVRKDGEEYTELLKFLICNRENFVAVKAGVNDVLRHHAEQFKMDYMRFYEIMVKQCPLAIFAVLMNNDYRDYYLSASETCKDRYLAGLSSVCESIDVSTQLLQVKTRLQSFLRVSASAIGVNVFIDGKQVDGEGYLLKDWNVIKQISDYEKGRNAWQDEIDGSKKVMVLWNDGVEARPYHDNTNQYKPGELNGKFEIMNGLEYRVKENGYNVGCLLYMEV